MCLQGKNVVREGMKFTKIFCGACVLAIQEGVKCEKCGNPPWVTEAGEVRRFCQDCHLANTNGGRCSSPGCRSKTDQRICSRCYKDGKATA